MSLKGDFVNVVARQSSQIVAKYPQRRKVQPAGTQVAGQQTKDWEIVGFAQ
jgi:hypothetical protein